MATKKKTTAPAAPISEEAPDMDNIYSNSSPVPTATEQAAAAEQAFAKADAAARKAVAKAEAARMAAEQAKLKVEAEAKAIAEAEAAKTKAEDTAKKKTEERVDTTMSTTKNWFSTHKVGILVTTLVVVIISLILMTAAYVGVSVKNARLTSGEVLTSDEGVNALIEEVANLRTESEARDKKQSEKIDSLTKRVAALEKENKELRKDFEKLLKRVETLEGYHKNAGVKTTSTNLVKNDSGSDNGGSNNGGYGSVPVNTDITPAVEQIAKQTEKDDKEAEEEKKRREDDKPQDEMTSKDDVVNEDPKTPTKAEEDDEGNINISGGESTTDTPIEVPSAPQEGTDSSSKEEEKPIDWSNVPTVGVDDDGGVSIVEQAPVEVSVEIPVEELIEEPAIQAVSEENTAENIAAEEAARREAEQNSVEVLTIEVPVEEVVADAA